MHRIDGPGATVDNKFTEGNPTTAVPATDVTDDWLNDVQEELISILAAAGITPVKGDQNQVLEALEALYGGALVTPPQFDNDTSPATTAFVQRALGNSRGYLGVTGNTALTAAHCGLDIFASTSSGSITLTLPAASALAAGSKFRVMNTGVDDVIVTRVGGDTIVLGTTSNTVTAVTLKGGDWIELASLGTGVLWYHTGGTGQLKYSFGAPLIGVNQTWQDLSGSRAGATAYQNTTSKPIQLSISGRSATAVTPKLQVSSNGSTWIDIGEFPRDTEQSRYCQHNAVIPVGWYYRADIAITNYIWAELR